MDDSVQAQTGTVSFGERVSRCRVQKTTETGVTWRCPARSGPSFAVDQAEGLLHLAIVVPEGRHHCIGVSPPGAQVDLHGGYKEIS